MIANIRLYSSDSWWRHIFADLGANLVDSPEVSDVNFDEIDVKTPISVSELQNIVINRFANRDIIRKIFGRDVVLSVLQHRIVVFLYKNPNITINMLKKMLGVLPGVTSHTVENAIYQLRKAFGHDLIQNIGGKYKIGCL